MRSKREHIRSAAGFTLIELLVVVIIIGILAAIALPNFIGAQDKAREASVKANMRTCQIAAESYATDNSGNYPTAVNTAYESYFPGGSSDGTTAPPSGYAYINPFSGQGEFPTGGAMSGTVASMRTGNSQTGNPGQIYFLSASPPDTYAIVGIGKSGKGLSGSGGTTLVLSNQ